MNARLPRGQEEGLIRIVGDPRACSRDACVAHSVHDRTQWGDAGVAATCVPLRLFLLGDSAFILPKAPQIKLDEHERPIAINPNYVRGIAKPTRKNRPLLVGCGRSIQMMIAQALPLRR